MTTKTKQTGKYPRITTITLENFMRFNQAQATFDDNNIINLKGYNSAGKSAFIKAFRVLTTNYKSSRQVRWIKTGEDEFKVSVSFEDGNTITKGKLKNGKSWYEMRDIDDNLVYTTIDNGIYTKIVDVPDVLKKYMGFFYNDNTNNKLTPHFLKSRDPLLLVDTTGKENYDFLNEALQGEDLIKASELAKNQRADVASELSRSEDQILATKDIYDRTRYLSDTLLSYLTKTDANLDKQNTKSEALISLISKIKELNKLVSLPKLEQIDTSDANKLALLNNLLIKVREFVSLKVTPELELMNQGYVNHLKALVQLKELSDTLNNIIVLPKIELLKEKQITETLTKLNDLLELTNKLNELKTKQTLKLEQINTKSLSTLQLLEQADAKNVRLEEIKHDQTELLNKLDLIQQERKENIQALKDKGYAVYVCKNCGAINLNDATCPVEEV